MFRRISALLLCIVMIVGMLPVSVFAEEPAVPESSEVTPLPEETSAPTDPAEEVPETTESETEPQQTEPARTEAPTEPAPVETEPAPTEAVIIDEAMDEVVDETGDEFWQNLDPSTANVLIPDGVTYIPDRAFKDFTNLKSVYIPASVTTIEILGTYYESPFYGRSSDVVIYCESASAPAGWDFTPRNSGSFIMGCIIVSSAFPKFPHPQDKTAVRQSHPPLPSAPRYVPAPAAHPGANRR